MHRGRIPTIQRLDCTDGSEDIRISCQTEKTATPTDWDQAENVYNYAFFQRVGLHMQSSYAVRNFEYKFLDFCKTFSRYFVDFLPS